MSQSTITPIAQREAYSRSVSAIVEWLRDLEECWKGGLLSDEEYAIQRAEKMSELLCEHRYLWLAYVASAGSFGIVGCSAAWIYASDLQLATLAGCFAALFGVIMLARPCRENLKQAQIRERLDLLNALIALDLISADEFLAYEERLHRGGRDLRLVANL